MDSGAFQELVRWGEYRHRPEEYAAEVNRLAAINPGLIAAASQDYMCEGFILERTGLSLQEHQRRTIERYCALLPLVNVYLMPVLQGWSIDSYRDHLEQYGELLKPNAWVGIGSVCKRNADMRQIERLVYMLRERRPDLRLHGFGLKLTALASANLRECLYSADSMAWSYSARRQGRDGNDVQEALRFYDRILNMPSPAQLEMML